MSGKRASGLIVLLLALLLGGCAGQSAGESGGAAIEAEVGGGEVNVGDPAPSFRLPTADGSVISLDELEGRAVVVNFWATWCGPCRVEMPELEAAYRANRADGLEVIAVEIRASGTAEESAAFLEEYGITFPTVRDTQGRMETSYIKRPAWPTTIFIDRAGIVRYVQVGPMDRDFIEARLGELGF